MIKVLDKGYIALDGSYGSDLDVVNAAKVSFAKHSQEYTKSEAGLLRFLMREKHGSPFEHNSFRFIVRAPIVVIWEWVRHRVGVSYNVESGRYTRLEAEFYIPERARKQVGKPGAYTFEDAGDYLTEKVRQEIHRTTQMCYQSYLCMIEAGVAKEQARLILPMNMYSTFYFTANARSIMNFLALRNHEQAMLEIRLYAQALEKLWAEKMPDTAEAFIQNERVAP